MHPHELDEAAQPAQPGHRTPAPGFAPPPEPRSERSSWVIAIAIAATGLAVLLAVITGAVGQSSAQQQAAPTIIFAPTPVPGAPEADANLVRAARTAAIVARPTAAQQRAQGAVLTARSQAQIARTWMEGFYPIYETAQRTFGVNWLLLASIHMQETAFSTAPGTYHGLNFAGCCGGPMQFNVTNGPVSTWDLVSDSYLDARRPARYDHMTTVHPSIYDDFDAIMAAAHLLSADGAGYALGSGAWDAAYDYYGHDATGVVYADQVLARAISWSQHGFCIECAPSAPLVQAVQDAYGAPVLNALTAAESAAARAHRPAARAAGRKA
jgi:hypothetical protein